MKKVLPVLAVVLIFVLGLGIMLYPTIANYVNARSQTVAIDHYEEAARANAAYYEGLLEQAQAFNREIFENGGLVNLTDGQKAAYETLLNLNGDGVISYVMFKGQEDNQEAIARTKYGQENADAKLVAAGADVVTFSGDKVLGGPQAGIIVGKRALIAQLQSHPLKRALRADKMTLAALEATLRLYLHPEKLADRLPTLRLLSRDEASVRARAEALLPQVAPHYPEFDVRNEPCLSQIGSGSLPVDRLPSEALTFPPRDGRGSQLEALSARWRALPTPVIGRIGDGRMWLDLRCLEDEGRFLEMMLK